MYFTYVEEYAPLGTRSLVHYTPLCFASESRHLEIVRQLLTYGVDGLIRGPTERHSIWIHRRSCGTIVRVWRGTGIRDANEHKYISFTMSHFVYGLYLVGTWYRVYTRVPTETGHNYHGSCPW